MMKVINPLNRKQDSLESAANLCSCICSAVKDNKNAGKFEGLLPGGGPCGCKCNGSKANKNANNNSAKNH